jgi:hypothetical protein
MDFTKWVMTESESKKCDSQKGLKVVRDDTEDLNTNTEVAESLNKQLGSKDFGVWYTEDIPKAGPHLDRKDRNQKKYEAFVTGYLYFYDTWVNKDENKHDIYFKWREHQVTVFISPKASAVLKPIHYSVDLEPELKQSYIADAATAASDPPPPPTIPPPPM